MRSRKGDTISDRIDKNVFSLLCEYLENKLGYDSIDGTKEQAKDILRELRQILPDDMIKYCQDRERSLQRVKHVVLRDSIKRSITQIREFQQEKMDNEPETDGLSDFEGVDPSTLMDVNDTNQLNRSVVNLWNTVKPAEDVITGETVEVKKRKEIYKEPKPKRQKEKNPDQYKPETSATLTDLGGIENIMESILDNIVIPLSHPEMHSHLGAKIPQGVLLHGPPGCGKTMLANAVANTIGIPFVSISAPSVVSGMSGESEKKLRDIFEEAKSIAPCIIFIDEIDAITPKRESVQREMERRIVAQLLTCMDSLSSDRNDKPIMVIGATNRPDSIDPALRRGGRFDKEICMNVPDQLAREKILYKITSSLRLEGDFNFKELARRTPGYVGADLQALVSAASARAVKRIFTQEFVLNKKDQENSMEIDEDLSYENQIRKFLDDNPNPLSAEQLAPLAVTTQDFYDAVATVQPSSKREGFTTVPDVTWDDVGAMNAIREELEFAIVMPIKEPDLYKSFGANKPAGVLLWGPPGCGKTLLAKAVANESQANFISVRGPELLNKYVGESERAVRQLFLRARASVPCVIFFDELDALVPRRDETNSEASSRVVNTLLTELDGVGDREGVYVIGATNRREMIDPAMLRPGRLDKQLFVALPTEQERAAILETVTNNIRSKFIGIDLGKLAKDERCRNFSGADLAALVREASVSALKSSINHRKENNQVGEVFIDMSNFEEAFTKVRPSVNDVDRVMYEQMNKDVSS